MLGEMDGSLLAQLNSVGAGLSGGLFAGPNMEMEEEIHHLICPRADIMDSSLWSI